MKHTLYDLMELVNELNETGNEPLIYKILNAAAEVSEIENSTIEVKFDISSTDLHAEIFDGTKSEKDKLELEGLRAENRTLSERVERLAAQVERLTRRAADDVTAEVRPQTPQERRRAAVYATGNKWAIANWNATHN